MRVNKMVSRFTSVVVVRTTEKIVEPPDPLSWWSCGPLLIKVCVKPCSRGAQRVKNPLKMFFFQNPLVGAGGYA